MKGQNSLSRIHAEKQIKGFPGTHVPKALRGGLSESGNYDWDDILDKEWMIRRDGVRSYAVSDLNSQQTFEFDAGAWITIEFFDFVDGIVFVGFYNYNSETYDYIPLYGASGNGYVLPVNTFANVFFDDGLKTVEQKAIEAAQENESPFTTIGNSIIKVGGIIAGALLLGSFVNSSK